MSQHEVKVDAIVPVDPSKGQFRATGAIDGRPFAALSMRWKGSILFKVEEEGELRRLDATAFPQGLRTAIGRACGRRFREMDLVLLPSTSKRGRKPRVLSDGAPSAECSVNVENVDFPMLMADVTSQPDVA